MHTYTYTHIHTHIHTHTEECGVDLTKHLKIATNFLHDVGVLRYFGDVDRARAATEKELRSNTMLDTGLMCVCACMHVYMYASEKEYSARYRFDVCMYYY
jgi:hypothetical protein